MVCGAFTARVTVGVAGLMAWAGPSVAQPGKDTPETPREGMPLPLPSELGPDRYVERLPSAATGIEMVRVPGREEDGRAIPPFWMSATEITWDVYDVYVFQLDLKEGEKELDGVSRPSKPYVPPDRGYGHAGYAAIGMTRRAAEAFCVWLSKHTGRTYRLPTEAEWRWACEAGERGEASLAERAWYADNANDKTQPVGKKAPDALGLHDMHGNVAEWVAGPETPTALGGSYRQSGDAIGCDARLEQDATWNMSDPQIPKSRWWLADCSWVGFRVVCEDGEARREVRDGDDEDG